MQQLHGGRVVATEVLGWRRIWRVLRVLSDASNCWRRSDRYDIGWWLVGSIIVLESPRKGREILAVGQLWEDREVGIIFWNLNKIRSMVVVSWSQSRQVNV